VHDKQLTLEEVSAVRQVRGLSENQRKIISLVGCGLCQADIARKIKFSRSYVNQVIKRLESLNLIQRIDTHKTVPGKRAYTLFYELSPELQARVKGENVAAPFTEMRTHHIQIKFKIISQSALPTKDKRTSFNKSWFMRGKSERFKYWYIGRAGLPSVSLTAHPKTIVISMDKGQKIVAASMKEAEQMAVLACYQAKDKFVQEQAKFGVTFETEHTGVRIGKTHVGLAFREGGPLDSPINIPGMWVDKSVEKELGPGFKEVECHLDHELATPLEKAVMSVATIEDKLPEMFRGMIDPLNEKMVTLVAQLQGGRPIEQMFQNSLDMMLRMMEKMDRMDAELKELRMVKG
jgi:predicted transcriptional regulator